MGFLKKLFSSPAGPSQNLYNFQVRCSRCGEIIEGRINLNNDLSVDYENDRDVFFVRKVLMGGGKCFQRVEVEFKFTPARKLIERHATGGEFV